jgi:SAM-dependent methyltransferase
VNVANGHAGEFYDSVWEEFGHLDRESPASFHRRRITRRLALRHAASARRVLDAGAGQGLLVRELSLHMPAAVVAGADVSARSRAETARLNPDAPVFELDLQAPDFEPQARALGRFELVVCSEVLEHLPDDREAAHRLRSLLEDGGRLIVTVPGGRMSRFDQAIGHRRHYDTSSLTRVLRGAGLEVVECFAWGFPFQNMYRSAVRVASRVAFRNGSAKTPRRSLLGDTMQAGYEILGRVLVPLFYLNRPYWGEQLFAVAVRPRGGASRAGE